MTTNKFITFEGGEGSGKSTQVKLLTKYLKKQGHEVVLTREPGGTDAAEKIRDLLLSEKKNFSPEIEVLLNFAARKDHVENLIKPALAEGKCVICDRFFDSTYVYQGVAQGVALEFIDKARDLAIGDFFPDLTFVLDVAPEISLPRAQKRGDANHFEAMDIEFHKSIRDGFKNLPPRAGYNIIDANKSLMAVHHDIIDALQQS